MRSLRLAESAASSIEVNVLDPAHDEATYPALRAAFRGGRLHITPATADAVCAELCDLSNHEDGLAREPAAGADEQRFSALAARTLATAMITARKRAEGARG